MLHWLKSVACIFTDLPSSAALCYPLPSRASDRAAALHLGRNPGAALRSLNCRAHITDRSANARRFTGHPDCMAEATHHGWSFANDRSGSHRVTCHAQVQTRLKSSDLRLVAPVRGPKTAVALYPGLATRFVFEPHSRKRLLRSSFAVRSVNRRSS